MDFVIVSVNKNFGGQTLRGLATSEFYACYRRRMELCYTRKLGFSGWLL